MVKLSQIAGFCFSIILCFSVGCDAKTLTANPKKQTPETEISDAIAPREIAAREAIAGMLTLAKAGDWENYIKTYYAEIDKITTQQQYVQLEQRYREKWGIVFIAVLEQIVQVKPTFEGDIAIFEVDLIALKEANQDQPVVLNYLERDMFQDQEFTDFRLHLTDENEWKYRL